MHGIYLSRLNFAISYTKVVFLMIKFYTCALNLSSFDCELSSVSAVRRTWEDCHRAKRIRAELAGKIRNP